MKVLHFLGKGVGHEENNKGCQDRLSVLTAENGTQIFAVSDGCSSSKYAEEAAQCNLNVVNNIFSHLKIDALSRETLSTLYPYIQSEKVPYDHSDVAPFLGLIFRVELFKLNTQPNNTDFSSGNFCATLLFVVREKEKTLIGHIGDGNIILFDKQGTAVFRSEEDNGEDSSHTFFTVDNHFAEYFHRFVIPTSSYNSLMLFSDGPQRLFYMETGSILKGASEYVMEPFINGKNNCDEALKNLLKEPIGNAMHYVFDDWSIIAAKDLDDPESDESEVKEISLRDLFFEVYNRRKEEADRQNSDEPKDAGTDSSSSDSDTRHDTAKVPKMAPKPKRMTAKPMKLRKKQAPKLKFKSKKSAKHKPKKIQRKGKRWFIITY